MDIHWLLHVGMVLRLFMLQTPVDMAIWSHRGLPQLWQHPTQVNSTDGLFPTFVTLGLRGNGCDCQPGSLIMAVSTPGTDSRAQCKDIF